MRRAIVLPDSESVPSTSIRRDEAGKILCGYAIGDVDLQNIEAIIEAPKGDFKEFPTLGFGIARFLKKPGIPRQQFIRELTVELKSDNMKPTKINVSDDLQTFSVEL